MQLTKLHRKFAIVFLAIAFSSIFSVVAASSASAPDQGEMPSPNNPLMSIPQQPPQEVTMGPKTANFWAPFILGGQITKFNDRTLKFTATACDWDTPTGLMIWMAWYKISGSQLIPIKGYHWLGPFTNGQQFSETLTRDEIIASGNTLDNGNVFRVYVYIFDMQGAYGGPATCDGPAGGYQNSVPTLAWNTPVYYFNDHLVGAAVNVYDADAPTNLATLSVYFEWRVNNVLIESQSGWKPAVKNGDPVAFWLERPFATGEVVYIGMRVYDGISLSSVYESWITVSNQAPTLVWDTQVYYFNDHLIGAAVVVNDADAPDPAGYPTYPTLSVFFEWYVDDEVVQSGFKPAVKKGSTVSDWIEGPFATGEEIYLAVRAFDGAQLSGYIDSWHVVENKPPTLELHGFDVHSNYIDIEAWVDDEDTPWGPFPATLTTTFWWEVKHNPTDPWVCVREQSYTWYPCMWEDTLYQGSNTYDTGDIVRVVVTTSDGSNTVTKSRSTAVTMGEYYYDPTYDRFFSEPSVYIDESNDIDHLVHSTQIMIGGIETIGSGGACTGNLAGLTVTTETAIDPDVNDSGDPGEPVIIDYIAISEISVKLEIFKNGEPMTGTNIKGASEGWRTVTHGTHEDSDVQEISDQTIATIYNFIPWFGDVWQVATYVKYLTEIGSADTFPFDPQAYSCLWAFKKDFDGSAGWGLTDLGLKLAVEPVWNLADGDYISIAVTTTIDLVEVTAFLQNTAAVAFTTVSSTSYFDLYWSEE